MHSKISLLFKILSPQERKLISFFLSIILLCLLILGINSYFQMTNLVPIRGGHYIEGLIGQPSYLNPLFCQTSQVDQDLTPLIFRSLFRFDKEGKIVFDLAEKYEISEDKNTYTVFLKKDQFWEDRQRITIDDIIFTVESIQNPIYKSPLALNFRGVKIEKIDDSRLKFTLRNPYPFFLENLSFGILPKHIWQEIEPENILLSEINLKPIGSGPFKVVRLVRNKKGYINSVTLKPLDQSKIYLEKITFKFYSSYQSLIEAYQKKEILGIGFLDRKDKERFVKKPVNIYSLRLPQYSALFFNQEKNEILKNKKIRQALSLMIDKKRINREVLFGEGKEISVPFFEETNLDFSKAEEILEKEGWKKNEKGIRFNQEKELKLTLITSEWPEFLETAEILKENWQKGGVVLEIKSFPLGEFQEKYIKPRNYEILLFSQILGHSMDFYPFWHSQERKDPGLNLSLFSNRKADELIEKMRLVEDKEKKEKILKEFQKILEEEIPAIFLYQPNYLYLISKKIKGFDLEKITNSAERFTGIEKWYIKTKREFK